MQNFAHDPFKSFQYIRIFQKAFLIKNMVYYWFIAKLLENKKISQARKLLWKGSRFESGPTSTLLMIDEIKRVYNLYVFPILILRK